MKRIASSFVLAAILPLLGGAALAEPPGYKFPVLDAGQCRFPAYPKASLRKGEEGLVFVGVQVDEKGAVLDTKILLSSGSAELDKAAQNAFRQCPQTPGTVGGQPVTMWVPIQYLWSIEPSNGKLLAGLKQAALDGNLEARYALGAILSMSRRTEDEKAAGLKLVISAAEAGEPMAQIALAAKYDSGKEIARDLEKARQLYEQAAAQGNVIAIDRLRLRGEAH